MEKLAVEDGIEAHNTIIHVYVFIFSPGHYYKIILYQFVLRTENASMF